MYWLTIVNQYIYDNIFKYLIATPPTDNLLLSVGGYIIIRKKGERVMFKCIKY